MTSVKRKKDAFLVYILFVAIFKAYFIPYSVLQIYKLIVVCVVLLFLLANFKMCTFKNPSFFLGLAIIASSCFGCKNGYISSLYLAKSVYYAVCLTCIYMLMKYFSIQGRSTDLLIYILDVSRIYFVLSVLSMFTPLYKDSSGLETYLFGNKFFSSYYILMYIAFFYALNVEKIRNNYYWKMRYLFYIFMSIMFSIVTKCSTSIVASIIYLLLLYTPKRLLRKLKSIWIIGLAITISALFPLVMESIMNLRPVRFIVVNILGESLSLNYRDIIYNNHVFKLISKNPIFGYGYGNRAILERTGNVWANAQNGMLDTIINYGIIGGMALAFFILYCFKKSSKKRRTEGISFLIYTLIINGTIEITYEWIFLWALCVFRWLDYNPLVDCADYKNNKKLIKET